MEVMVNNLTKSFGRTVVLDDLNFHVSSGEVVGFLGPNGAGKTTTMRILTGFLAPTRGQVLLDGHDLLTHGLQLRRHIGYLPENNPLYLDLKVYEYLEFTATAKSIPNRSAEVRRVIAACGLRGRFTQLIGTLSKGFKQRVGVAAALLGNPTLIIMDEPTAGLDPNQVLEIRTLIREIGRSKTIILSTHVLSEVEATCTSALIIHQGKIVASGSTAQIVANVQGRAQLRVVILGPRDEVRAGLATLPGVKGVNLPQEPAFEPTFLLESTAAVDLRPTIFQFCVARQWPMLELERRSTSLEEVFHQLTTEQLPSTSQPPMTTTAAATTHQP